jgi:hypothetical protein
VFALAASLRQRGDGSFGLGGGDQFGSGNTSPYPFALNSHILTHLSTVWSMPGGFSTGAPGGYQAFGGDNDDLETRPAPAPASQRHGSQGIPSARPHHQAPSVQAPNGGLGRGGAGIAGPLGGAPQAAPPQRPLIPATSEV